MKNPASAFRFFGEAVIFLFPLIAESCAFVAAIYVKNSGFENGSRLLFLLAAVKLACSLLEYKGFEEAYLANSFGAGSIFARIGLLQLIQGIVLPAIVIACARYILSWSIDPLFASLLVWTGILTSSRQFLSYHWRAQLKSSPRPRWPFLAEITLAYLWLALLAAAALGNKTPYARELTFLAAVSWKVWIVFVLARGLAFLRQSGPDLIAGLSLARWIASIGQAFTSQLSKEIFIMATTASVTSGFIARVVVTAYGLVVAYPVTFYRIRIFDQSAALQPETAGGSKAADLALRKISLLLGAGCLVLLPLAGRLPMLTGIDFPFAAMLLALGLIYPLAAFDAMAYFALIKRGRRSMCSLAAAAGGVFAIASGYIVVRSASDAWLLAFLLIAILGVSDFILNRVSKILASR